MSKHEKVIPPGTVDDQSVDLIKKPAILQDDQLSENILDDIDQPSLDILSQNAPKISSVDAQTIINEMAKLPELDYQLIRVDTAKFLNITLNAFDKLVKNVRGELAENTQSLVVDIKPCSEPIKDIASIANQIYQILNDHIACTDAVKTAVTLWIILTWVIPASHILPIAWINAPERRCGKSTLLALMSRMSNRSLSTSNITGPALFRCIEAYKPTLFIDEVDTFLNENEGIRGVLNAGHSRDNPYIIRCVGDDNEPVPFNVYGAKAISGIGKIPSTLIDRSISLTLERKMKHETKKRVRDLPADVTNTIQSKLARWSDDNLQALKDAKPVLPVTINDRAQDNWEILLKIALVLGDGWLERAYSACIEISGIENEELSLNEQLLLDIQTVYKSRNAEKLSTKDLIKLLCLDPEMPWSTFNDRKPITPIKIGSMLRGFRISSKTVRTLDLNGKEIRKQGYNINQFQDAFSRYLS